MAVPAGGSTTVSAGRYLDLGNLGKYLPNKRLYYKNGTEPPGLHFSEDDRTILIDGIPYEMQ